MGFSDVDCLVHLDDNITEHGRRMTLVFKRIRRANFKLGIAKCTFAAPKTSYLGHILSKDDVSPDQSKVTAISIVPDIRRSEM
jgi:hypothetical protein